MPDGFLRTQLAESTAGKAAPDGERQRDDLAVEERREAGHRAYRRAGVRPGDEAGEKSAFETEVRGVVVEEQPSRDAACQRHAERQSEDQAVGPIAAFEDQDVAEASVPDEHRRQGRHDGELHDQRREQHLLGGEKCRSRHVLKTASGSSRLIYLILAAG